MTKPTAADAKPTNARRPTEEDEGALLRRGVDELTQRAEEFLQRIETALRNPYEYASARKDYEGVLKALAAVEAGVQRRGAAPVDSRLAQLSQDQLLAVAKKGKEKIDSDLMKMAAASAAARQRLAE